MRVTVVGGGISGLTAAYQLLQRGHAVTCVDEGAGPGGFVRSIKRDGFLCEAGPQALLDNAPATRALIEELGLSDRIVNAAPTAQRRFIFVRGRLREVPTHPVKLLTSDLLTWRAKWRLLREPFVAPGSAAVESSTQESRDESDESILAFAERRLGPEVARNVVAPAIIGIFAGDAARLSVRAATPRLFDLEQRHGSLWKGLRRTRVVGKPAAALMSLRGGLGELPAALARKLGTRFINGRAARIREATGKWMVDLEPARAGASPPPPLPPADVLVLACGADASATLLSPIAPAAAVALRQVATVPAAVINLGFVGQDIGVDLRAYGFLVARGERLPDGAPASILGCQFDSSVFPGRAPEGGTLLRVIAGGAFEPACVERSDEELVRLAVAELKGIAGLRVEPTFSSVFRYRDAIPQYELGHRALVAGIDATCREHLGLHLLGFALRGVGVNDCIGAAADLATLLGPAAQPA